MFLNYQQMIVSGSLFTLLSLSLVTALNNPKGVFVIFTLSVSHPKSGSPSSVA